MECINFDKRFEAYTMEWMRENASKYGDNIDAMEAQMPALYTKWLSKAADWLGGVSPRDYFASFSDADMLAEWMLDYFREGVPVPDQLLERLTALGEPAEAALMNTLVNGFQIEEARLTAISLLAEMESRAPLDFYIKQIVARSEKDDMADMAADALIAMGDCVVLPVLEAAAMATVDAQITFADVLCNFPGDARIPALCIALLEKGHKRALMASLLSKLGDSVALPSLVAAAKLRPLSYLDFVELRNAIEALGGDAPEEPEFSGDPYYESLKRME